MAEARSLSALRRGLGHSLLEASICTHPKENGGQSHDSLHVSLQRAGSVVCRLLAVAIARPQGDMSKIEIKSSGSTSFIRVFLSPARNAPGPSCAHFKSGGNCTARTSGPVEDLVCRNHRWL